MFFSNSTYLGLTDDRLGDVFGRGGVRVEGGRRLDARSLYRTNVWVRVALDRLSRGVAKTPLKAYEDDEVSGRRTRLLSRGAKAHDLSRVIERPWEGATQFNLKHRVVLEYLTSGVSAAWMDRGDSLTAAPKRIIPMRSDQLAPQYRSDGEVAFYEWRKNGLADPIRILPENVLITAFEDRTSPLDALVSTLEIDIASQRTTAAFYENGAQVGNVLTTEKVLRPDAVAQLEEQLRSDHKGPSNAFRTLLLANLPGAQWHNGAMTSSDAQTIEHRKLSREEVLAAFNIPQPIGGVLDRATFSNIETQTRMWVVDTLGEHFAMIESAFNGQLIQSYKGWDGCFVEFDTGEILRGTPTQRAETYLKWLHSGTRTVNELRRLENLPRIEDAWADAVWVPANLTPIGLPGGMSGTPGGVNQLPANASARQMEAAVFSGVNPWQDTAPAAAGVE